MDAPQGRCPQCGSKTWDVIFHDGTGMAGLKAIPRCGKLARRGRPLHQKKRNGESRCDLKGQIFGTPSLGRSSPQPSQRSFVCRSGRLEPSLKIRLNFLLPQPSQGAMLSDIWTSAIWVPLVTVRNSHPRGAGEDVFPFGSPALLESRTKDVE